MALPFRLLILQHPREAINPKSTARLLSLAVPESIHRVGLAFRSLSTAVGGKTDPQGWGVLYLGGKRESREARGEGPVTVLRPKGPGQGPAISGVVALDGNWKQSKSLWWRNPWLLRLNRIIVRPKERAAYGSLRREPRPESLSTLEAIAHCAEHLGHAPAASEALRKLLDEHLALWRS